MTARKAWLDGVRARAEAASPAPWHSATNGYALARGLLDVVDGAPEFTRASDAEFAATARAAVPALLAEIERLEKSRLDLAKAIVDAEWASDGGCPWCNRPSWWFTAPAFPEKFEPGPHAADCIVLKARAALPRPDRSGE